MKRINKRIQTEGIDVVVSFYDNPTPKGFPTKESLAVMVIGKVDQDAKTFTYGVAVKVPGDEFKGRIGKAIALKDYLAEAKEVTIELHETAFLFSLLKDLYYRLANREIKTSNRKQALEVIRQYVADIALSA